MQEKKLGKISCVTLSMEYKFGTWYPIEEAPKNKPVLIGGGTFTWDGFTGDCQKFNDVTIACWDKWREAWQGGRTGDVDEYFWYQPTHWMSLPIPPQLEKMPNAEG